MMDSYELKKNAEKRGIAFKFTEEEWDLFSSLNVTCFFMNTKFNSNPASPAKASVDRLDPSLPYQLNNCVWSTTRSNHIKSKIEEKQPIRTRGELMTASRIKKVLNDEELFDRAAEPYRAAGINLVRPTSFGNKNLSNFEVIAKYVEDTRKNLRSGEQIASLSSYKKAYNRKTCSVSGDRFDGQSFEMIFIRGLVLKILVSNVRLFKSIAYKLPNVQIEDIKVMVKNARR